MFEGACPSIPHPLADMNCSQSAAAGGVLYYNEWLMQRLGGGGGRL